MNRDQLAAAIDAERAQIAHEIHDALLPLIFAASAALQRELDDRDRRRETDPQRLRQAQRWLQDALRTGRQIISLAHPPELADCSWDIAAQRIVQQQLADAPSPPEIDWQIEIAPHTVSAAVAAACYRIVVEAIRNAIAHGNASLINVRGNMQPAAVIISVTDNGRGFDPDEVPADRFGLRSMKGRAELVGGELTVASKPGGPTTVRLSVPVKPIRAS